MNKKIKNITILAAVACILGVGNTSAQNLNPKDTIKAVTVEQKDNRNVMLNAANNTGPRDVNIGLPASVGGTTVLENGLPVVYFFWPEIPPKAWRSDATINRLQLLDLGQTAIHVGDVGFSVSTYDNLGTDKFQGKGSLNSNHFGLLRGDINLSGPLNKKGLKFTAGAYVSYDPGTFKTANINRYYSDRAQLYKGGLTQDYKFEGGKGSITAFYKYVNVQNIGQKYSPFIYDKNGKVKELDGFKMGRESYYEQSGKITLQDAFTGQFVERDILKDYGTESHTLDLIGNNTLNNGLNINYILRYHQSKVGNYLPLMTGVTALENDYEYGLGRTDAGQEQDQRIPIAYYQYEDGTPFNGKNVQSVLALASKRTPIKSLTGTFEVGKKSGRHDWKIGLNQWVYNIDQFATEGVMYQQEVAANPMKLVKYARVKDQNTGLYTNDYRKISNDYNNIPTGFEYHNGTENKTALFMTDKWDITDLLTVNLGARFEYQSLRGDYQDANLGLPNLNGPKTKIKKDWLNKAFMLSAVYKVTDKFGVLGEATYNEQAGHLENYSIGKDPKLKKSKIPGAGFGVFFNHPMISLVSKATYIKRDQYRTTVNFSNPTNAADVKREITSYDIQTIGWTTDIVANPFKNFNLHVLFTLQSPKYKNYTGTVDFGGGVAADYNFSDKIVTGVSKVLIEIDPSYQWNNLRLWASARYFSKQYFNKPNTLDFAGRWETFAGANYSFNKHFDLGVTVVNLLNQRGASGSIPDADLISTAQEAKQKEGTVMSGTYIRPFTVEFGMKYRF